MRDERRGLVTYVARFTLVYSNGWENPSSRMVVSNNPSEAARMIFNRCRSGNIVGVRVLSIDGERCDLCTFLSK